jgi:hypothetical protein
MYCKYLLGPFGLESSLNPIFLYFCVGDLTITYSGVLKSLIIIVSQSISLLFIYLFIYLLTYFVVLGLELRIYTLNHPTALFFGDEFFSR